MFRDPLALDVFISLAYWEEIDFCGYSVCCGTPQAIGSFLRNTDLIPMSQKSSGLCSHHKLGKFIGLSMMVCYACCNKFPGCNLSDFNIIRAESNSLRHSGMSHLIYTQEIGGQGGYIQNMEKVPCSRFVVPCPFEIMVE